MLGEIKLTQRGFERIEFSDADNDKCSLQQSSATTGEPPGASFIWLGCETRMHLNREQVKALTEHLVNWLNTGSFKGE